MDFDFGNVLRRKFTLDTESRTGAAVDAEEATSDPLLEKCRMDVTKLIQCPNPKAIPRMDYKKGTTTLGIRFRTGIVVAVDSRASSGQYIASQTVQKVLEINNYMLGTMAGGAADCQFWFRVIGQECRLWELRNGTRITIAAASKILANITYSYRNRGLSMGSMLAGYDAFGPHLYYVDDQGDRIKHDIFSVGSGSVYAYGVLDSGYNYEMSAEDAVELARRSIYHATHRDAFSGGYVSVYLITKEGWKKISRDDQTDLHRLYNRDM
jgi:20S proteasome subunit beta 5